MSQAVFTLESLGRVACFAAIELEQLAKTGKTSVENISAFSQFLEGNFSVASPAAAYLSEPMSAYAVTSTFCDPEKVEQSMEEIFSRICTELTTPLKEIALAGDQIVYEPRKLGSISRLIGHCLAISEACVSVDSEYSDLDEELCW